MAESFGAQVPTAAVFMLVEALATTSCAQVGITANPVIVATARARFQGCLRSSIRFAILFNVLSFLIENFEITGLAKQSVNFSASQRQIRVKIRILVSVNLLLSAG